MLDSLALQVSLDTTVIAAIIVAFLISTIFFAIQRRTISSIKSTLSTIQIDPKIKYDVERIQTDLTNVSNNLVNLRTTIPHTNEINVMQENVSKLCNDFSTLQTNLEQQMSTFRYTTTEDLNNTKDQMIKNAAKEITEFADNHIKETSVSREEFENLKQRLDKLSGGDESTERISMLSLLFDSSQIRVINWQCDLFKLLRGGLSPEAEEDHMVSKGIPMTNGIKFLKKLNEFGVVELKQVQAYYLDPEYEWIYSYIENPDWLQKRLEDKIKKERDYQSYIQNNLKLIEEGLLLEEAEYQLATGKIDFICRDKAGNAVGLELKYPGAATSVIGQLMRYKKDYEQKTGNFNTRFILVAPKIPDNLQKLLINDGWEFREIDFKN